MFRKNSFFVKLFLPVIAVMLLQIGIIGLILFLNGTIDTIEDAAIAALAKNADTRGASLEQMMVNYWSNLDRLEMSVMEEIDAYLKETGITIEQAIGSYEHEVNMLENLSQPLISTLRTSSATGVFVHFLDIDGLTTERQTKNGLYYRDHDPLSSTTDNSDIIFLKGFSNIARKDKIQLDSLWEETFAFDPANDNLWRRFANPQIAAVMEPKARAVDLAYWNGPHLESAQTELDSNKCITYTRPVFYDGRPIALIGSEVQVTQLEKYFPASDFDSGSQSGYMLANFDQGEPNAKKGSILHITGGYIRRMFNAGQEIELKPTRRDGIYQAAQEAPGEAVQMAYHPIRLYNANSPFANEQWALVSIGTNRMLFQTSRNITVGIALSFTLSFALGGILLAITIRRATDPLISIAEQIENTGEDGGEAQVYKTNADIYEINLLCSTLNHMSQRRSRAEMLVREERQRYLIALESATDTFVEYDVIGDSFMLYYFVGTSEKRLASRIFTRFSNIIRSGEFCHPDEIPVLRSFLNTATAQVKSVEIRVKASVFSHITNVEPDNGYFWFVIKASNIINGEGKLSKIIGTSKEITSAKLEEFAKSEAMRRDPATKFYNRDYGIEKIIQAVHQDTSGGENAEFLLCEVCIDNFDEVELFYGRVFGVFVLMQLARSLKPLISERDIAVRLSNDDFLFYFPGLDRFATEKRIEEIKNIVSSIYVGENTGLQLYARVNTAATSDEIHKGEYFGKPVSILLDVSKANIVSAAFDLFERTSDIHSSVKVLLAALGEMFKLDRIAVCAFDAKFGANQVAYQWMREGLMPLGTGIVKISHKDAAAFETLLDENGTFMYTDEAIKVLDEGVLEMLCAPSLQGDNSASSAGEEPAINAYCCVMYENASHIGRVLFISSDPQKQWEDNEKSALYDIVKVMSAHISIDKSQSASRAKSEFLSRVSHEIRTPMNAIIGMTDIAKSIASDPQRLRESLDQIDFSAKHLLSLINDVLEMSRIESGKLRIEYKPFSLDGLISGIETLMRVPISSRGIAFNINKNYNHRYVRGDEHRLRQVLVNLLGNASKFTETGGIITFTIEQIDEPSIPSTKEDGEKSLYNAFMFSVADTGIGISPEEQQLVFEAFEQAGAGTSAGQQEGTGLGLAISSSIISAMGGKIELTSNLGEGSNFYFTLVLELCEDDLALRAEESKVVDYTGRFVGKRALLVDDVRTNVAVAAFALNETGIDIDVATNGKQALEMFGASEPWHYDIIFMDVKMPIMDGFTATRMIRGNAEREDARAIPIVAMTANAYDEDMQKTIESGMNGHITKPIEKLKLFELMAKLLEK